jgi:signal transduction histidine kinase
MRDETMVAKYFDKLKISTRRMSELIRSVLNYSKLSKPEGQFVDTDLNLIINHVKTDFELLIQEKHAEIRSETLPVVKAMPQQLSQLFANLISNSLKFTEKNPLITIKSRIVKRENIAVITHPMTFARYIEIEVADNGIGFEQQYEEQIFAMFQRLHGRHEYAGTGIGLALCKKIVDNHNGQISAKSELGKGTTFYVHLPII